jgi:hypothetical protein
MSGKRMELLKEVVPGISRVGFLRDTDSQTAIGFKDYEAAASALKIRIQSLDAHRPVNVYLEGLLLLALDSSFLPPFGGLGNAVTMSGPITLPDST